MKKKFAVITLLLISVIFLTGFSSLYGVDIELSGTQQYKAVALTPEIMNHAGTSALRILDRESGEEVPFFLHSITVEEEEQTTHMSFAFLGEAINEANGYYYLDFRVLRAANIDPVLSHLVLRAYEDEYLKNITVFGSYDGQHWTEVTTALVYHVAGVHQNIIPLEAERRFNYYRLRVPTPQDFVSFRASGRLERYWARSIPFTVRSEATFELDNSYDNRTVVTVTGLADSTATLQNLRISGVYIDTDSTFKREFRPSRGANVTLYRLLFQDTELINTFIPLRRDAPMREQLSITIMDHDDSPINILGIEVEFNTYYLVFLAEAGREYSLIFGGDLEQPRYDIENFRSLIIQEGFDRIGFIGEIRLLEEYIAEGEPQDFSWLFNVAIILVSLLHVVLVIKGFIKNKSKV